MCPCLDLRPVAPNRVYLAFSLVRTCFAHIPVSLAIVRRPWAIFGEWMPHTREREIVGDVIDLATRAQDATFNLTYYTGILQVERIRKNSV